MKLDDVIQQPGQMERIQQESVLGRINVARPGIVLRYDEETKCADIQLAVRDIGDSGIPPVLNGVPVVFMGSYTYTVKKDDECVVLFADSSIDGWWQTGTISKPVTGRKHDLSDGFALVGVHSMPNANKGENLEDIIAEIQSVGLRLYINEDGCLIFEKDTLSAHIDENGCVIYDEAASDIDFYLDSDGCLWMED